jgi:hypothetical protein
LTFNPTMIRQHGRIFYYGSTHLPTCHTVVLDHAAKNKLRVIGAWSMAPGETMWKMQQITSSFAKNSQYEFDNRKNIGFIRGINNRD